MILQCLSSVKVGIGNIFCQLYIYVAVLMSKVLRHRVAVEGQGHAPDAGQEAQDDAGLAPDLNPEIEGVVDHAHREATDLAARGRLAEIVLGAVALAAVGQGLVVKTRKRAAERRRQLPHPN